MNSGETPRPEVTEEDIDGLQEKLAALANTLPPGEQGALRQLLALAGCGKEAIDQSDVQGFGSGSFIGHGNFTALPASPIFLHSVLRVGAACGAGTCAGKCKGPGHLQLGNLGATQLHGIGSTPMPWSR